MKTPAELRAQAEALEALVRKKPVPIIREKIEREPEPVTSFVNCKSCGAEMDVTEDPAAWQLQCSRCKRAGVPLPPGYERLEGGPHDGE